MSSDVNKGSFLNITLSLVLVIGSLYWARAVLIPFALALLLTFVLQPIVAAIHRKGLGRTPAALLVVALVALVIGGVGWVVVTQFSGLAYELPHYKGNLKQKIDDLRNASRGGVFEKIQETIGELTREFEKNQPATPASQEPVTVLTPGPSLISYVPSFLEFLANAGLVLALLLFMLIAHADLRDRLFRLVGYGRLTVTTKALDEAGRRISRYLLMQCLVNGTYGCAVSLGLFVLGVPYALLWGLLAAALRFIPYVGTALGVVLPVSLSLAVFAGWVQPLLVGGLIVLLEITTNMILEPLLYGRSAGVSKVALIVAIMFWTWLWGPVGLLLSTPLTVCLGVLGKYVPQLSFLGVLLSDEQVTELNRYYQRLVAQDQDGAVEIVEELLQTQTLTEVYDAVLVPALYYAKQDQQRNNLTPEEAQFIYRATHDLVEDLGASQASTSAAALPAADEEEAAALLPQTRILGCPAHDEADEVALQMLQHALDPRRFAVEITRAALLTAEVIALVEQRAPALICIGLVPPGGFAQTRYLCKRLRISFPQLPIVIGCWGGTDEEEDHLALLRLDSLTYVNTTLLETCQQIMQLPQVHVPLASQAVPHVA
jgi:predicted PurR-regulated permease PerM